MSLLDVNEAQKKKQKQNLYRTTCQRTVSGAKQAVSEGNAVTGGNTLKTHFQIGLEVWYLS